MRAVVGMLLMIGSLLSFEVCAASLKSIEALDIPRYMGRWHEIARYPNVFQRACAGEVTADYSLLENGHLRVLNRCREADGQWRQAIGEARRVDPDVTSQLEVRFAPRWLSFIPAVWGDYWVIDIDEAYSLVAISEPEREYLWVLSRTPAVDAARYEALVQRLTAMGFDRRRLEMTRQSWGESGAQSVSP